MESKQIKLSDYFNLTDTNVGYINLKLISLVTDRLMGSIDRLTKEEVSLGIAKVYGADAANTLPKLYHYDQKFYAINIDNAFNVLSKLYKMGSIKGFLILRKIRKAVLVERFSQKDNKTLVYINL